VSDVSGRNRVYTCTTRNENARKHTTARSRSRPQSSDGVRSTVTSTATVPAHDFVTAFQIPQLLASTLRCFVFWSFIYSRGDNRSKCLIQRSKFMIIFFFNIFIIGVSPFLYAFYYIYVCYLWTQLLTTSNI